MMAYCRLFNAKTIVIEEQFWYYLSHSLRDNWVYSFPKDSRRKVDVIIRLEFEIALYDIAVELFKPYKPSKSNLGVMSEGWLTLFHKGSFRIWRGFEKICISSSKSIEKERTVQYSVKFDFLEVINVCTYMLDASLIRF